MTPDPPPQPLVDLGWDARVEARAAGFDDPGRVVRVEYGHCAVRTATGEPFASWTAQASRTAGVDASPVVGDWVEVADDPDEGPVVLAVAERWSVLSRHDPAEGHTEQVLAANLDVIFVVAALDHALNVRRLDRMLAMAWDSGARPVLLLTKPDLADAGLEHRAHAAEVAGDARVVVVHGLTGEGLDDVRLELASGTAVFLGPSGVGKSTIVNHLVGDDVMATGEVRARDRKGRHTTTSRELHPVPGGGVVIDTPGIRGVQLWDAIGGVDRHFRDLAELGDGCRFGDCAHAGEPGCAVAAALGDGRLEPSRVERWLALRAEIADWTQRQEEHERRARRGRGRR